MTQDDREMGIIEVVMERFQGQRLPRILSIKQKVDAGNLLDEFDIGFLREVFEDASQFKPLLDTHPEYQSLCSKAVHLYHEITQKALENEGRRSGTNL